MYHACPVHVFVLFSNSLSSPVQSGGAVRVSALRDRCRRCQLPVRMSSSKWQWHRPGYVNSGYVYWNR